MPRRWINLLSIPFLFFSTGLPLLMLRHNCHLKTVQKILLWTPVVPLVIVQVALRAIVLTTLISDSADRVWAVCEALEGWSLLLQVLVFILVMLTLLTLSTSLYFLTFSLPRFLFPLLN